MSPDETVRRRGRRQMFLLLAISAAPIVLGTLAFYLWPPSGRTNYGELMEPVSVAAKGVDLAGRPATLEALRGRWVLVVVSGATCAEECRRSLLYTRQIRTAQGRDQGKVERAWIVHGSDEPDAELAALASGAQVIRLAQSTDATGLPADAAKSSEIHFVDPLGRLVMRYPSDPDPRKVMKDLQRLLRVNSVEYAR